MGRARADGKCRGGWEEQGRMGRTGQDGKNGRMARAGQDGKSRVETRKEGEDGVTSQGPVSPTDAQQQRPCSSNY